MAAVIELKGEKLARFMDPEFQKTREYQYENLLFNLMGMASNGQNAFESLSDDELQLIADFGPPELHALLKTKVGVKLDVNQIWFAQTDKECTPVRSSETMTVLRLPEFDGPLPTDGTAVDGYYFLARFSEDMQPKLVSGFALVNWIQTHHAAEWVMEGHFFKTRPKFIPAKTEHQAKE